MVIAKLRRFLLGDVIINRLLPVPHGDAMKKDKRGDGRHYLLSNLVSNCPTHVAVGRERARVRQET